MKGTPTQQHVLDAAGIGFTAERLEFGPKGSPVWIVRDLATREELACYPADDLDWQDAILRLLQQRRAWQERVQQEQAS